MALAAFLTAILLGLIVLNDLGEISFAFIATHWDFLLEPAATALGATIIAYLVGFTLAIPCGLIRAFGPNTIRQRGSKGALMAPIYGLVTGYAEFIRGTPAFVQILIVQAIVTSTFRGVVGISFWSGTIALLINTTAYQTEVFRAGFQSVGQGQIEAAKSIGMRPAQTLAHITFPQGLRLIVLPLANEWIGLFKASSLMWYIGVQELLWAMEYLGTTLNHPIDAFILGSLFYLAIIIPLSRAVTYIEQKKRTPGLGVTETTTRRLLGVRGTKKPRT